MSLMVDDAFSMFAQHYSSKRTFTQPLYSTTILTACPLKPHDIPCLLGQHTNLSVPRHYFLLFIKMQNPLQLGKKGERAECSAEKSVLLGRGCSSGEMHNQPFNRGRAVRQQSS